MKQTLSLCRAVSLLFLVEGHLDLDFSGKQAELGPGEALLIDTGGREPLTLAGNLDADFYLLQFQRGEVPAGLPLRVLRVPSQAVICNPGRLKHLFRLLLETMRTGTGCGMTLHYLVVLMLCEMASSALAKAEARVRPDGLESIASRVDAYIAAHYRQPIGTPEIASEFRYNPDYLERAYRTERHISIREAIHLRRNREARAQLLLQRSCGIAEIAALCGYSDAGHFRRVFKRDTGMTPHEFRIASHPARAV